MHKIVCVLLFIGLFVAGCVFATGQREAPEEAPKVKALKAGFVYAGPIGDLGWTHAHNAARLICEKQLLWLETVYQESVSKGAVQSVIERMFNQEGCDVVFTTSFGLMAGALTKSGKIGYVDAFPMPEVKRHINAFAIGIREVNPEAEVHVRWINTWFDPAKAKEATEALISEECDVFAFTEDSPTVVQAAAEHGLPSFAHYSPMHNAAPNYVVSGQLVHWEVFYLQFLGLVYEGVFTHENLENLDYWGLLKEEAVEIGADFGMLVNPKWKTKLGDTYNLVLERWEQMRNPQMVFDPFTGPIYDRKGNLIIPAGERADYLHLLTIQWAADGVVGPWPGEP